MAPPIITGTAQQGQILSISNGDWTNSPTAYTRQWVRCDAAGANCVAVHSATSAFYMLTAADVGSTIRCWTTAYNSVGVSAPVLSAQTAVVSTLAAAVPENIELPVITGTPASGYTLAVSNGAWAGSPSSYTRQWLRCDAAGANCIAPVGYVTEVSADSPRAWYRCQEASGLVQDSSGNANHAVSLHGASSYTYQEVGAASTDKAIFFNGSSQGVNHHATLNLGDVFTLEAWIKRNALTSGGFGIVSKGVGAYYLRIVAGKLELLKSNAAVIAASTTSITDSTTWHHVVVTKNGPTVKLYIDGVDRTGAVTNVACVNNTSKLMLGSDLATTEFQNGRLDEIAVYSTALSAARVLAHYNAGASSVYGATGTTYALTSSDVGKTIRCDTVAVNATGSSTAARSAATAVVGALAPPPPPPPAPPPSGSRRWADSSPINTLISANPSVLLNYGQGSIAGLSGIGMNGYGWGTGVFLADGATPKIAAMTQPPGGGPWKMEQVPFPTTIESYVAAMNALGDVEAHLVVFDSSTGRAWNLYNLTKVGSTWYFGAAGVLNQAGSGFWNNPLGPWLGRASGFCSATGIITKAELAAGVIEHALACCWPKERIRGDASGGRAGSYVAPATSSDGSGLDTGVPMGSLLQLNPTLTDANLRAMGIPDYYLPVCRAMQRYGCYVADSSGWMALYAESYQPYGANFYPAGWHPASQSLVPHLRMLAPPPAPAYDSRNTYGQPHQ